MNRLFNAYKLRYEFLNKEFLPARASIGKINRINIYINLDDFCHRIHRPYTDREFQTTGQNVYKQIVSNILNLIAHYKNWATKEMMQPKIFLFYTTSMIFKNTIRVSTYRNHYKQISQSNSGDFYHINSTISAGYNILPVMTKYVRNAYSIDSNYLEPSIVPLFLSQEYPADYHLLVSRDEYDFQYVQFNRWAILIPKGDESVMLNKGNLWEYICRSYNVQGSYCFHPELFVWAKTIMGDRYRTIPKLTRTGWKTVIGYLKELSSDDMSDEILTLQLECLIKHINAKKISDTDFNDNLYCTSVKSQVDAMLDSDKAIINHQIVDMEDNVALREVNNTIFKEFPIELGKLLREVNPTLSRDEIHDDYTWRKNLTKNDQLIGGFVK